MGAMFAFVVWIVAIAIIYAFIQSQAQSGAMQGVARVSGMRVAIFAGQSALEEACYVIRHPAGASSSVLDAMNGGGSAGTAHEPDVTRAVYAKLRSEGTAPGDLTLSAVSYKMVGKCPPPPDQPASSAQKAAYLIDLAVKVDFQNGGVKLARTVRRRYVGYEVTVTEAMGPKAGQVIARSLMLRPGYVLEVIE
jgi:hypothetical protein